MSIMGQAINWLKVPHRKSNASWLADMVALHKLIYLCSACEYKMPWRWKQRYHYTEFTVFHGEGLCDSCRYEGVVTLYRSMEDPWFETCERQARLSAALDAQERAFNSADRRRVLS